VRTTPKEEYRQTAEKNGVNLLWVAMHPDGDGKIYLGNVLDELDAPMASGWVHHVAAVARERTAHADVLARRLESARRERDWPGLGRPDVDSGGAIVQEPRSTTGTFWCAACRRPNARFIPDFPGSHFGRCAQCGALASPTLLH
jgi:hypothetical protein